jgi:hypothetical protein
MRSPQAPVVARAAAVRLPVELLRRALRQDGVARRVAVAARVRKADAEARPVADVAAGEAVQPCRPSCPSTVA